MPSDAFATAHLWPMDRNVPLQNLLQVLVKLMAKVTEKFGSQIYASVKHAAWHPPCNRGGASLYVMSLRNDLSSRL